MRLTLCCGCIVLVQSRLPVRPFEIVYDAAEPYKSPVVIDSMDDGVRVSG